MTLLGAAQRLDPITTDRHRRPHPRISTVSGTAAQVSIGATVAALASLVILHLLSPEFDPAWRMVSEYANGHYAWLLSLMFACWGLGSFALAYAIRRQAETRSFRIGIALLIVASIGEAMAAVFDLNHVVLHNVAGLLGMGGLPVAAMLISIGLSRVPEWLSARRILLLSGNLTWVSLLVLAATFVLMVGTFMATGLPAPAVAPRVLPHGVVGLVGWGNRLVVLTYCLWVVLVAGLSRKRQEAGAPGRGHR
jgi:hypothetical membrane protein